ncbi:MAG: energy transducer TonB [Steroidobacteraceae bacterium]
MRTSNMSVRIVLARAEIWFTRKNPGLFAHHPGAAASLTGHTIAGPIWSWLCWLPLLNPLPAIAQIPTDESTPALTSQTSTSQTSLLNEWDRQENLLRAAALQALTNSEEYGADLRRRKLRDDIDDYILDADTVELFAAQRRSASELLARGDTEGARAALGVAQVRAGLRFKLLTDLSLYWRQVRSTNSNAQLWQSFVSANRLPRSLIRSVDTEKLEAAALNDLRQENFRVAAFRLEQLRKAYVTERNQLARDRAQAPIDRSTLTYTDRNSACGAAAQRTSENRMPRLASSSRNIDEFYPASARRNDIEGSVVLSLKISDSGCATAAAVLVSSGSTALDAAALAWFDNASYYPAEQDGHGVAAITSLAVTFKLAGR